MGPLNISVRGEYALRALLDIAMHGSDSRVKIARIAARQKIPQKFLELILAGLKQGGFVESQRGAQGGYLLARPPDKITAGEVLRFVEGTRTRETSGRARGETPFTDLWRRLDQSVSKVLDHTTFADLAQDWREKQARHVPNWDI